MARVLVVDDNATNRDLVVTLLGYRGHAVDTAVNGLEALEAARQHRPDLVISDLVMPVMDGYELMREIRADESLADLPAIFYTANYLENEVRPMAAALGVPYLLAKPIDPENLLHTVDQALTGGVPTTRVPSDAFHREHQRAVSAKLADKVSELEQTEAALVASEARFRALAEHSPIGIFSLDATGSVSYANPKLLQLCGEHAVSSDIDWASVSHPDDRQALLTGLAVMVQHRGDFEQRLRLVVGDAVHWVDMQVAPVADEAADITFVGTLHDITASVEAQQERDEIERRLNQSERLESLGELAAGIAHDFNNALSVIMSYNEFLGEDLAVLDTDQETRNRLVENSDAVRRAADRAAGLTHRLMVFARRGATKPELINANVAVHEALDLLTRTIGGGITLVPSLDSEPLTIMADRTQLEQVVVNLVVNSRDAIAETTRSGRVEVATGLVTLDERAARQHGLSPGDYALLRVSDNGCGMPADVASRVFEPFYTTKPADQGTGLGLSTVYGIATSLGGEVLIDSTPGVGTAVRVLIPLAVEVIPDEPALPISDWA